MALDKQEQRESIASKKLRDQIANFLDKKCTDLYVEFTAEEIGSIVLNALENILLIVAETHAGNDPEEYKRLVTSTCDALIKKYNTNKVSIPDKQKH